MDSQLKVIQAEQNIVVQLVEALDKDFQSEIYFDPFEAKAQLDSKKDSVEKNSQVAKIVQAPESKIQKAVLQIVELYQAPQSKNLKNSGFYAEFRK